jgi:hypothetical protein
VPVVSVLPPTPVKNKGKGKGKGTPDDNQEDILLADLIQTHLWLIMMSLWIETWKRAFWDW